MKRVVIIGGGPAGSTLAALLSEAGSSCIVFEPDRRPDLLVGESLVPSIVPILQRLGIEDEVRSYSLLKPGACFCPHPNDETFVDFSRDNKFYPPYSYNVPRNLFDQTLKNCALAHGAKFFSQRAELAVDQNEDLITLCSEQLSLAAQELGGLPEIYVDATGRARCFTKLLRLKESRGRRDDVALFAHVDGSELQHKGCIHVNRLSHGWAWRIPLPDRVSIGIVIPISRRAEIEGSAQEQFDQILKHDPILSIYTKESKRISGVKIYNNYQLISERFIGKNWALVGDAAGFVDPIFSSGLQLAMLSAQTLASELENRSKGGLKRYEKLTRLRLSNWQKLSESYYEGRVFGLVRASRFVPKLSPWRAVLPFFSRELKRAFSGLLPPESWRFSLIHPILGLSIGERFGRRLKVK